MFTNANVLASATRVLILMKSYTSASVLVRFLSALLLVLWPLGLNAADVDTPPPGVLVDVDGHKVHLYCTGSEGPTVVLLAGASSFSIDWALVQPKLSSRTCAFDRPGYAWSDAAGVVDDGKQVVRDLHESSAADKSTASLCLGGPLARRVVCAPFLRHISRGRWWNGPAGRGARRWIVHRR